MLYPFILCGGAGTRLWPTSREAFPKQFVELAGQQSLFTQCLQLAGQEEFQAPTILTSTDYRFIVAEQARLVGIKLNGVILEPCRRNTAPSVLVAALSVAQSNPEGVVLVLPSDLAIPDPQRFISSVHAAFATAQGGSIVTFGIQPTRPETGYGYLEVGTKKIGECSALLSFVEKPDEVTAQEMLKNGNFFWNAGIFMFRADVMISAFETYASSTLTKVKRSLASATHDLDFLRLDEQTWHQVPSISVDYAIMERVKNLAVMPYSGYWSDLGSWLAVSENLQKDADDRGNIVSANALSLECESSFLWSDDKAVQLVGIGLSDMIAVATNDAVLVVSKGNSHKVGQAVASLKAAKVKQAVNSTRIHRPWGWFDSLVTGEGFQVKQICVNPGGVLSLQSHQYRAEHWIVVSGTAKVTVGDDVKSVAKNQSVYVPLGTVHRLENPGADPMLLIEVQTGTYFGEDDIVRYADVYARDAEKLDGRD
ncbi:mannose-1-phosphate guanylyltransferase/mannose-6-phosphate isomerase [Roseobacter sp. HKCCA0882]|uniref:mannose-1-phosphate guanylyltransferase/mannose-6-phosphate isomerase n=1 Tax=Roseobacter sp. HKCCA0882 TaxID=3120337 RepID=UPI0030ECE214